MHFKNDEIDVEKLKNEKIKFNSFEVFKFYNEDKYQVIIDFVFLNKKYQKFKINVFLPMTTHGGYNGCYHTFGDNLTVNGLINLLKWKEQNISNYSITVSDRFRSHEFGIGTNNYILVSYTKEVKKEEKKGFFKRLFSLF